MSADMNKGDGLKVSNSQQVITLSQLDIAKVFALLDCPPNPNKKLKSAVAKHRVFFDKTD